METLRKAFRLPDLRRKILYTLGILVLYRLLANIPVPGVDARALSSLAENITGNALIDTLDLLSGGAVSNFSVMAMGVYPYITASIIIQLLTPIVPYLEELDSEGESGRNKKNKITYYLTVPLAIVQAVGQINLLGFSYGSVTAVMPNWGLGSATQILATSTTMFAMVAGTMFAIWLGERITEEGVGQGVSLIIFSGIVSGIPQGLFRIILGQDRSGLEMDITTRWIAFIAFVVLLLITTYVVVLIQQGERRLRVEYGRRVRGRKVYQGQSRTVPLKVNTAGMIPIIFASSLLAFPGILAQIFATPPGEAPTRGSEIADSIAASFGTQQGFLYWSVYFVFVFAFTFFYTDVMVGQQKLDENLQKQGGFIPGIRPGPRTKQYIKSVVRRITFVGALFLSIVAVTPGIMEFFANILNLPGLDLSALVINGSGLIIVVGVVISTWDQIKSEVEVRQY